MENFELNPQLKQDCYVLGEWQGSFLLLLRNALYPWFILVPKVLQSEIYLLDQETQTNIQGQINMLSQFLKEELHVHKINIGAIGNLVPQLHIHVIGREKNDPAWPGVVWGSTDKQDYTELQLSRITATLKEFLGSALIWSQGS